MSLFSEGVRLMSKGGWTFEDFIDSWDPGALELSYKSVQKSTVGGLRKVKEGKYTSLKSLQSHTFMGCMLIK